ncbi:hypothetical protein [Ensifer adhaerens]|uniref:hypothetical protein n=1 Tax=Ensifer adhaerens TaxID=106592 RepID=UPI001F2C2B96|nr:hypothetical protein [Ensifer adhaerens]
MPEPSATEPIPPFVRLLNDVAAQVEVVGLGITEHLPWDAIAIRDMLRALPLIGREKSAERPAQPLPAAPRVLSGARKTLQHYEFLHVFPLLGHDWR